MKRVAIAGTAVLAVLLIALSLFVLSGLPSRADIRVLARKDPATTALMRQREEEARRDGREARRAQSFVPLSRISRHLVHAVIASEDQRFLGHEGVDWEALQDSLEKNVERGRAVRGGSTITQQLAKNLFFGTEKTLLRKVREMIVARWLEEELTKARILTLYLNVIEWGDGTYGCEAAAQHWYGKPAADLGPTEAAGLAAMIPNPRRINPRVSPAGHERATRRVLRLMELAGYIGRDAGALGAAPPPEPRGGQANASSLGESAPGAPSADTEASPDEAPSPP